MRKEIEVTTVEKKVITSCDTCNEEKRTKQCGICNKDVCFKDSIQYGGDVFVEGFHGDYCRYVCRKCWEIGSLIRDKIEQQRSELDIIENQALDEWIRVGKQGGYEHVSYKCDGCQTYFDYSLTGLFSEAPKKDSFHKECPNNGVIRKKIEYKDYPNEIA